MITQADAPTAAATYPSQYQAEETRLRDSGQDVFCLAVCVANKLKQKIVIGITSCKGLFKPPLDPCETAELPHKAGNGLVH